MSEFLGNITDLIDDTITPTTPSNDGQSQHIRLNGIIRGGRSAGDVGPYQIPNYWTVDDDVLSWDVFNIQLVADESLCVWIGDNSTLGKRPSPHHELSYIG
jgi:hypothetical protein